MLRSFHLIPSKITVRLRFPCRCFEYNAVKRCDTQFSTNRYRQGNDDILKDSKSFETHRNSGIAEVADFKFTDYFQASKNIGIYDVQEGGFVTLNPQELDKYLPEGLSGELDDEFDFSDRKEWMIRDSTKLLCRLVEEFENSKSVDTHFHSPNKSLHSSIFVPGLSDRPEWNDSHLRVKYYGAEINRPVKNTFKAPAALAVVSGQDSVVEDCIVKLRDVSKSQPMPTKVMLTGALLKSSWFCC